MATLSWFSLLWCLIPLITVAVIYWRWQQPVQEVLIASVRMIVQLIAVGYFLIVLFKQPSPWVSVLVVAVMMVIAAWIAIRPVRNQTQVLIPAIIALLLAVGLHLAMSLTLVLQLPQWYLPHTLIPLAGMYLANTMNALSLSAERYFAELSSGGTPEKARSTAFSAAMIPQVNSLLAVGLVALPGMMTGQILSGVSPLIAVRYQIMIMAMILGCTGLGSALLLTQLYRHNRQAP